MFYEALSQQGGLTLFYYSPRLTFVRVTKNNFGFLDDYAVENAVSIRRGAQGQVFMRVNWFVVSSY